MTYISEQIKFTITLEQEGSNEKEKKNSLTRIKNLSSKQKFQQVCWVLTAHI